jgi:hypothetical protein
MQTLPRLSSFPGNDDRLMMRSSAGDHYTWAGPVRLEYAKHGRCIDFDISKMHKKPYS